MAKRNSLPDKPLCHSRTNRGYVQITKPDGRRGQKTFPGEYGSEKMWNAFRKWRADQAGEYHSESPQAARRRFATVEDVWCAFYEYHAKRRLAGDPRQSRSDKRYMQDVECVGRMLQPYQHIEANTFDSQMLDEVLENEHLKTGNGTKRLNDKMQLIQKCFKFGVRKQLVDAAVYGSLLTVEKFNKLDRHIKQPETRLPCSESDLLEALAHASPTIHTMLMVASLTGMRSDNICKLSWDEIDTSREEADGVWLYKPLTHKTAHMGKELTVVLGTKCIQALRRYEEARPDQGHPYIFNPHANFTFCRWQQSLRQSKQPRDDRESWATWLKKLGNRSNPCYSPDTFRGAVLRILKKHNINRFVIHQLRHYHSNNVFQHYADDSGIERQQAVIGHHTDAMSRKYTLNALELAIKTQREIG